MKKLTATILALILVLQLIPFVRVQKVHAYTNDTYENGFALDYPGARTHRCYIVGDKASDTEWTKIQPTLPVYATKTMTEPKTGNVYGINFTLWNAFGIVVYGDHNSGGLNPRRDQAVGGYIDFKTDTKYKCGTYYTSNGEDGQFRYRGFDIAGNPYSNTTFPPDTGIMSINSYKWIYRTWKTVPSLAQNQSPWNIRAQKYVEKNSDYKLSDQFVDKWIHQLYKDEANPKVPFSTSTTLDFNNTTNSSSNTPSDYANVMSCPTLTYPGEAKLWSKGANGSYYYRTTFIPAIKDKIDLHYSLTGTFTKLPDVVDHGVNNTPAYLASTVDTEIKINAVLHDDKQTSAVDNLPEGAQDFYSDQVLSTAYYTRKDIKGGTSGWTINVPQSTDGSKTVSTAANKGSATFTVKLTVQQILAATNNPTKKGTINVNVSAAVHYQNGHDFSEQPTPISIPVVKVVDSVVIPPPPPPQYTQPSVNLPSPAFDIVAYHPSDSTDVSSIKSKEVYVDGTFVDYNTFFSGSYVFGATGSDRLSNIVIKYIAQDGTVSFISSWVLVLNTKPRVQFKVDANCLYKQNRLLKLTNISAAANTPAVISAYPITKWQWTETASNGDVSTIKTGTLNDMYREYMYKAPGTYNITLIGTNTLNVASDPYSLDFEIMPDTPAAVICELDNVSIARGETIGAYYFESVSTDGDQIANSKVELYYDSNNDGTVDTLVQTWNNVQNSAFPTYSPTKLGMYEWKVTSTEAIIGETLPLYITSEDAAVKTLTKDFWVDNFIPQTDLYVDVPTVKAIDDTYILTDPTLTQASIDYTKASRMDFNNYLRGYNINPVVEIWDLKTYTYSQPTSTSVHTGSTYPGTTTTYTSNGYSGTLSRTSVSDNGSNQDFGSNQTKTETKTATAGGQSVSGYCAKGSSSSSYPPDSVSYSDGSGYSGTLSHGTYSYSSTDDNSGPGGSYIGYWWSRSYAGYSGTVSRTVTYWVSNWKWVADYTGFYSGTIYKDVKQPYTDPFRATSDKYVIYVSDGNITDLIDLQAVIKKSGAKLILIGQDTAKTQIACDYFILNDKPIAVVMQTALDYIGSKVVNTEHYTILAGQETFTLNTANTDQEGDPIVSDQYLYVQDKTYFDNPMANEPNAVQTYSDTVGWTSIKLNTFNNVGRYTIYHRVKDQPSTDPNFAQYSYYSNLPTLIIDAVRKPIALATLDWDFDTAAGNYKTSWVDKSYSLEHQYNRPDKGILTRKIMFRQSGGEWQYVIPSTLVPGTYELNYYVQSIEGYWSDPFIMNFTLDGAPPMQLNASLKTENSLFNTANIPASENLQVYNIWTRYPYEVSLAVRLYNSTGTVGVVPQKDIIFSTSTGTKTGNDINWKDISYTIPSALADGNYILRVTANGKYGQTKYINFPVTVITPINLTGYINNNLKDAELYTDENNNFTFSTSIYVTSVQLNLKGITYTSAVGQIPLISKDSTTKTWEMSKFIADGTMLDEETGIGVFTASLPSGASQTVNVNYKVIALRLKNLRISKIYDFSWKDLFVKPNGLPTALQLAGIQTKDMPVYKNLSNKYIKLGYKVNFKIDSMGLYKPRDEITVKVKYLSLDDKLKYQPVDLFFRTVDGKYELLGGTPDIYNLESFTLNERKRLKYEPNPSKNSYNTWTFDFYLPATIKVVRKGEGLDLFNDNTLKTKLLVLFDITCKKQGASTIYDYSTKETAWGTDTGSNYGRNYPTKEKILGKGLNAGEVFWYDLNESVLNDVDVDRQW